MLIIELATLHTDDTFVKLQNIFAQSTSETAIQEGEEYVLSGTGESVKLNFTIIKRLNKKKQSYRYEIYNKNDHINEGGSSDVYKTTSYLPDFSFAKHQNRIVKTINRKDYCDSFSTSFSEFCDSIHQEYLSTNNLDSADHLGMKPPIFDATHAYLTLKQMPGKDLYTHISEGTIDSLTIEQRYLLSIAIIRAIKEQAHDRGIIHRDIKPGNIIVDLTDLNHPCVNIIDFGLATNSKNPSTAMLACGTTGYKAPEVVEAKANDQQSDIFSLGRTLALIWGQSRSAYRDRVKRENILKDGYKKLCKDLGDFYPEEANAIIQTLNSTNQTNPELRPNIQLLYSNFKKLYCERLSQNIAEEKFFLHIKSLISNFKPESPTFTFFAYEQKMKSFCLSILEDDRPIIRLAITCAIINSPNNILHSLLLTTLNIDCTETAKLGLAKCRKNLLDESIKFASENSQADQDLEYLINEIQNDLASDLSNSASITLIKKLIEGFIEKYSVPTQEGSLKRSYDFNDDDEILPPIKQIRQTNSDDDLDFNETPDLSDFFSKII